MAKTLPRITTTDDEIDAAIARGKVLSAGEPRATAVRYDRRTDCVDLQLANGIHLSIPRALLQGLERGDRAQLEKIEIVGNGTGLHWPVLDVDHYVPRLLVGVFGTRKWMEQRRRAGSVSSPAKAAAARDNGRKGGRPKSNVKT